MPINMHMRIHMCIHDILKLQNKSVHTHISIFVFIYLKKKTSTARMERGPHRWIPSSNTGPGAWKIWCSMRVYMDESRHTCEWVKSHIRTSLVMSTDNSCQIYEWVMSHMNESCRTKSWHTREWVMSHLWRIHVSHKNESCHTYEWVMSHIRMSQVTSMHESRHNQIRQGIYVCVMSHLNYSCHTR